MIRPFTAAAVLACLSQTAYADAPNTVLPTLNDARVIERAEEFAQYPRSKKYKDMDTKDLIPCFAHRNKTLSQASRWTVANLRLNSCPYFCTTNGAYYTHSYCVGINT